MEPVSERKSQIKRPVMGDKALKVLANSIFQTLKDEGCENKDIIGVSSQLIGLVAAKIQEEKQR